MKHAGAAALDTIEPLLASIRNVGGLREKSRGIFYLKSKAFLHFHEDPTGMFVDIRAQDGKDFDRMNIDDPGVRDAVLARVKAAVG